MIKFKVSLKTYLMTFCANFGIQLFTIGQGIVIAHMLGVKGRGELSMLQLWPTLLATLGMLGSNIIFGRLGAKQKDSTSLWRTAAIYSLLTASVTALIAYFLCPVLMPMLSAHYLRLVRILLLYIFFNHFILNFVAIYQGIGDFKKVNLYLFSYYPIYLTLLVAGWLLHKATVEYCIISYLISNFVVMFFVWQKVGKQIFHSNKIFPLGTIFRSSLPFGASIWLQNGITQLDRFLVAYGLGSTNLGLYVVAQSAGSAMSSIGNTFGQIIFHKSATNKSQSTTDYIVKVFRYLVIIYMFELLVLFLLMPYLLPFIYGKDFAAASQCASLLLFGAMFYNLGNYLEQAIKARGNPYTGMTAKIIGVTALAIFGIWFGRKFGICGMAIAYSLSQAIMLLYLSRSCCAFFKITSLLYFIPTKSDFIAIFKVLYETLVSRLHSLKKHV